VSQNTRSYLRTILILAVFGASPILIAYLGAFIASVLGCQLDERTVPPCELLGANIGPVLNAMTVAVWFTGFTLAPALVGIVILVILWLISLRRGDADMDETDANA